jgi:Tfp pilus assembly protein PilV
MISVNYFRIRAARSRDARRRLPLGGERGVALLEVLTAGVILSVATIGLALMFSFGVSYVAAEGGERIALFLAQQRIEELRAIGLARATAESERDVPGFPGFRRSTTIVGSADPDGSGDVPRVITVSVRSVVRQAGPITVTAVYIRH